MKEKPTGMCSVYVRWEEGFHQILRPAYDSHPEDMATMTQQQVRTLRGMILRYMEQCRVKNGTADPTAWNAR